MSYKHILLVVDFSDHSKKTANTAKLLASTMGATLSLLHIVETLPVGVYNDMDYADIEVQLIKKAEHDIHSLAKLLHLDKKHTIIITGYPKTEILHQAEKLHTDLIVIGSHGQRGWLDMLGSTASAVVNKSRCDVLVVRS